MSLDLSSVGTGYVYSHGLMPRTVVPSFGLNPSTEESLTVNGDFTFFFLVMETELLRLILSDNTNFIF